MINSNDEFARDVYKYDDTLVVRQKDGKCWQLTIGDYMGEIDEEKLTSVGLVTLSD